MKENKSWKVTEKRQMKRCIQVERQRVITYITEKEVNVIVAKGQSSDLSTGWEHGV